MSGWGQAHNIRGGPTLNFFSMNQNILPKESCMQEITVLAQKLWICTPPLFQLFLAGQLDLRSNDRSKSNFDCRNGFLEVDYIGLDTSYDMIEDFTQNVRGVSPPHGGRSDRQFFFRKLKLITIEACKPKITVLAQKMRPCTPLPHLRWSQENHPIYD